MEMIEIRSDKGGKLTLFPSVHKSPQHINHIRDEVERGDYDTVCIELDEKRFNNSVEAQNMNMASMIEEGKLSYSVLKLLQMYMGSQLGVEPGMSDMRAGIEAAALKEIPVALIDQPVNVTVKDLKEVGLGGVMEDLSMADPDKLQDLGQNNLLRGMNISEMSEEENRKQTLDGLRELSPKIAEALVDRRDQYMARRVVQMLDEGQNIFAIVGAAHVPGLKRNVEMYLEHGLEDTVDVVYKRVRVRDEDNE